ncbi:MAG: DNA-directed RNA polymerase subunit beta [Proteobacteria bacterium]|nr:DNA-directed RNA polymerase subunit beta [Pseudomonadota bacterium]MDA1353019.1 DNA-directed RNA polymerase subunit beta [bacterium]
MFKVKPRNRVFLNPEAPKETLDVPNLLEIQTRSYEIFIKDGLKEEFKNVSPIVGYGGKYELEFLEGYYLEDPELSFEECKRREVTYSASLKVPVRLINRETGEIKEQEVFMSDIPLMTDRGTFLVNGAERVVVSQFVRSPGVYFRDKTATATSKSGYIATIIPNRGAWLEIECDHNNIIYAHINKMKRIPVTYLLGALGYSEADLSKSIIDNDVFALTTAKAPMLSQEDSLLEIYKILHSGEPITLDGAKLLLDNLFFNEAKYDLSKVGRYKVNRRLEHIDTKDDLTVLSREDVLGIVNYLISLIKKEGMVDDIDHLGNRRVRTVGEQLQRQFRIGLARLERLIREQMALKGNEKIVPQHLINIRPLVAVMREFFGSSQLSQFMDQTNPLAEIVHKRRLSALGPGGLTKERAGFEVRDIHATHYGRICPIETPEGPNAGLIGPLSTYGRVNDYGFIETPYHKVVKGQISEEVVHMTADMEEKFYIAPWDTPSRNGKLLGTTVVARYARNFEFVTPEEVEYVGVSPRQLIGVACSLIPFLQHDDANRALMGANMQRQAVPLINPEAPYVGTGMERVVARDSGGLLHSDLDGVVDYVSGDSIIIKGNGGKKETYELHKYVRSNQNTCKNQYPVVTLGQKVKKGDLIADGASTHNGELALGRNILVGFMPWEGYNFEDAIIISNRLVKEDVFTSIHIHRYEVDVRTTKLGPEELTREVPNVSEDALSDLDELGIIRIGAIVKAGDILVGKVTPKGETEPPAEEKLLRAIFGDKARDMRDTSLKVSSGESGKVIGVRVFSRDNNDDLPPGVNCIVRVYVAQLRKISIGDKIAGRHGNKGVISTILAEEDMPFCPNGVPLDIILNPLGVPSRMNVGQLFETLLGMASHVLGENYQVQLFDQTLEKEGKNTSVTTVEGKLKDASKHDGFEWIKETGTVALRDGRTGESFEREVTVGYMYVLKLIHLVNDKIHARSTGPYSLVTQQPLGGKAQYGGQRFGEMEVWALEAYGAANTLQEMLTIKSDDLTGRAKAYEAIIKGKPLSRPGTPESFRVLLRELRSIALDIRVMAHDGHEIDTR